MFDEWDEYPTYEWEDDLYQLNQREADDYVNEGDGDEVFDLEPDEDPAAADDFDLEDGPEME
jgi:hypothetical protein